MLEKIINPLKNISIHLHAAGPAAVLIVWIICVTCIGLYGQDGLGGRALTVLTIAGGALITSLAQNVK